MPLHLPGLQGTVIPWLKSMSPRGHAFACSSAPLGFS
jgi:hypothetical protein